MVPIHCFDLLSGSNSKLVKGTLRLNSEESVFNFEYKSFGHCAVQKTFVKGNRYIRLKQNVEVNVSVNVNRNASCKNLMGGGYKQS